MDEDAFFDETGQDNKESDSAHSGETSEVVQDNVYVDLSDLIDSGIFDLLYQEAEESVVTVEASELADTIDNFSYEISVVFMLGLIAGLFVWKTFSRKWFV